MLIGVPKEIKNHEYRIGLTPASARELINNGHQVMVENNGGAAIGFDNAQYEAVGAEILGGRPVKIARNIAEQVESILRRFGH